MLRAEWGEHDTRRARLIRLAGVDVANPLRVPQFDRRSRRRARRVSGRSRGDASGATASRSAAASFCSFLVFAVGPGRAAVREGRRPRPERLLPVRGERRAAPGRPVHRHLGHARGRRRRPVRAQAPAAAEGHRQDAAAARRRQPARPRRVPARPLRRPRVARGRGRRGAPRDPDRHRARRARRLLRRPRRRRRSRASPIS